MAGTDYRRLKPSAVCRLVNSTHLGPALSRKRLSAHRDRAGSRIGDDRTVDLIRYAAWLVAERHAPRPEGPSKEASYAAAKERARKRSEEVFASGRDIGEIPAVVDPSRRLACRHDFRLFCESYFPYTFHLGWSPDHLTVIGQIEESVLRGGLFATAMPRGSGKTSISECACVWAVLYGHRAFVALIGSDEAHAAQMLDAIKTELEGNDLLSEDFPEATYPISKLEGIVNRCAGQLHKGERTHIGWTAKEVVLPTIPGSVASGAIIKVAGLTGGLRGMKFKRPDGRTVRPSLVVIDDPQTDESSRSPSQCDTRERILAGAVLGLAGPGEKISGIMPCTVIAPGDMADRILDRDKHPDWNGTRTKMVYAFPSDTKLWDEYARLRAESLRAGRGGAEATDYYRVRRVEMDAGAVVAWPARFNHDELSAVQHAMNLRLRDERAFFSEYQNEPLPDHDPRPDDLTADDIAGKFNRQKRGAVPLGADRLTAFVDVQGTLLYYVVCAWEDSFTGYVVDYGAWPRQGRDYFLLREANPTLAQATKAAGLEGQIYGGLEALTSLLLGRGWKRDDNAELTIERCLIDANWSTSAEIVKKFCRESAHAAVLTPSHGKYVSANGTPMSDWPKRPGERAGLNWRLRSTERARRVRALIWDTNFWKSFLHSRLATAMGDSGCLSLFGDKASTHRMFADHLTAETRHLTPGRGRVVDEWKIRVERPDNHLLDCTVGCCVAASMQGVTLAESPAKVAPREPKARPKMSDMQRQRRA